MEVAIHISNLTKKYGKDTIANDRLNVEIFKNELFLLLGPNGAGKTTFLRLLSSELLPTEGKIIAYGYDVVREPYKVRQIIGIMPQEGTPKPDLTLFENIYYFARLKGLTSKEAEKRTYEIMKMLDCESQRNALISQLSAGFRKRVLLGIALVNKPKLLLLDEPTAGQDMVFRKEFYDLIESALKEDPERTVIYTTHDPTDVERLSHLGRIGILNGGRLVFTGSVDAMMRKSESSTIEDAFIYFTSKMEKYEKGP